MRKAKRKLGDVLLLVDRVWAQRLSDAHGEHCLAQTMLLKVREERPACPACGKVAY